MIALSLGRSGGVVANTLHPDELPDKSRKPQDDI